MINSDYKMIINYLKEPLSKINSEFCDNFNINNKGRAGWKSVFDKGINITHTGTLESGLKFDIDNTEFCNNRSTKLDLIKIYYGKF